MKKYKVLRHQRAKTCQMLGGGRSIGLSCKAYKYKFRVAGMGRVSVYLQSDTQRRLFIYLTAFEMKCQSSGKRK